MEVEDIAQNGEVFLPRVGKVDPEEAAAREQALDIVAAEIQLAELFLMNDMTDRGSMDGLVAPTVVWALTAPGDTADSRSRVVGHRHDRMPDPGSRRTLFCKG